MPILDRTCMNLRSRLNYGVLSFANLTVPPTRTTDTSMSTTNNNPIDTEQDANEKDPRQQSFFDDETDAQSVAPSTTSSSIPAPVVSSLPPMRVQQLEDALRDCIRYLGALPVVPATNALRLRCEAVLEGDQKNGFDRVTDDMIYAGAKYSPSGVLIAKVTITGHVAVVHSFDAKFIDAETRLALQKSLTEGVQITLARK